DGVAPHGAVPVPPVGQGTMGRVPGPAVRADAPPVRVPAHAGGCANIGGSVAALRVGGAPTAAGPYAQVMAEIHTLTGTASPGGLLLEGTTDGWRRRMAIDRERGTLVVIDHGDAAAEHRGGIVGVRFTGFVGHQD